MARQGLQKGALLRTINGYDLSGSPVTFDFSRIQRSTVLFVVSAVCWECTRSWPAWKTIVESLRGDDELNRLVVLDLTDSVDGPYVHQYGLSGVQCLTKIDAGQKWLYNFRLTPQTVPVRPGGRVDMVLTGVPRPEGIREIPLKMRAE